MDGRLICLKISRPSEMFFTIVKLYSSCAVAVSIKMCVKFCNKDIKKRCL